MLNASPGPVVAQDIWQLVMDSLLETIAAQPQVDGILLALHGAMVTEVFEDAEGEMLQRLRKAVGPDVSIMASLDLHVNMAQKMIDNADALFAYDYYPHTDAYETAMRAADIYEQGVATVAITDGDEELAQKTADTADNPGAGASSDSTLLLKILMENNAQDVAFASMYDPETVALAEKAGVGSTIAVALGGKVAPEVTGGPVVCTAYVKAITDGTYRSRDKMNHGVKMRLGKSALQQIGGIQVIVTSSRTQSWDLEVYRHFGIQPEDMKILVAKSTIHFRASFSKVAAEILDVEAPALALQDPLSYPLSHSRRPIYPMDEI